ncbi:DUF6907 domain-containing protein, partial [Streptomyces sp. MH13]|uniref:DUF6907 domain-containing protein n=1 Tax=Streptomyces sp. MH13 TaxID=3417651 RepID=UPI003CF8BA9C
NRTVTLPTIDHGDVTLPEPTWCAGHTDHRPEYRADVAHSSPMIGLELATSRGPIVLIEACIESRPFAARHRGPHLWLGIEGDGYPSTPEQARATAASLEANAAALRALADQLAETLAGEDQ